MMAAKASSTARRGRRQAGTPLASASPDSPRFHRRFLPFEPRQSFRKCSWNLLAGRTHRAKRRRSGVFSPILRRIAFVLCFLLVYQTLYYRLEEIELRHDLTGYDPQQQQHQHQQQPPGTSGSAPASDTEARRPPTARKNGNHALVHYLATPAISNASGAVSAPSHRPKVGLEEARKGREPILSILEDAGIDEFDTKDVLRLPLWSSVADLYYNGNVNNNSSDNDNDTDKSDTEDGGGPIILGLEGCARFREIVQPKDRFLGVAGNFNSGTTAFGISLQKNCRFDEHPEANNFVVRKRRSVFATNVNGMLSQVPWAKHKHGDYRDSRNHTIYPPSVVGYTIDFERVLPIVLVRDPFYWMQSMCKEGYGVRWDHDSKHHCPNLIPNESDRTRFFSEHGKNVSSPIPVWMGANPTDGPTWPSLIHYWNSWYESYYYNHENLHSTWPRLIVRFEDTLFYPRKVMAEVCHCGGGKLRSEPSFFEATGYSNSNSSSSSSNNNISNNNNQGHHYVFEEAKPDHKHGQKNNFVTALIEYGTNATRLRNMTDDDVRFAVKNLNPNLMKAFGYSYPNGDTNAIATIE